MLEDLFLTETPGESSSSNIELPEDIEQWPTEIQNVIYTQIPQLADVPGQLTFDTVEQDKRYAKGAYVVDTGDADSGNNIIFPILVKDGELMPIDIYLYKDEFRPVDTEDINAILMSPELGDETIDEQDIPSSTYSNFSNRINPPGAYGNGYVTSYKTSSLKDGLIDMIDKTPSIKRNLALNKVAQKHFLNFFDKEITKVAAENKFSFPSTNTAIFLVGDNAFLLKTASFENNRFTSAEAEVDLDILKNWAKTSSININKVLKDIAQTGMSIVSSSNEKTASVNSTMKEISSFGSYQALNRNNMKPETVNVLGYIKTASNDKRYFGLMSDGRYVLQQHIYGAPVSSEKTANLRFASLKPGETITFQIGNDGEFVAPVKVATVTGFKNNEMEGISVNGKSIKGNMSFIFLKNAGVNKPVKAGFIPKTCFIEKGAETWFVPSNYPVIALTKEEHLIKTAEDNQYSQFLANKGRHSVLPISLWKVTDEKVAMKSGNRDPEFIDKTAALLLINRYDTETSVFDEMQKIASGQVKKLFVPVEEKLAEKKHVNLKPLTDSQRLSILKVASSLDEGESIDDVLQLNYVNSENLEEFKENLPELRTAENMLAKLLLSTRLGNTSVEEGDVQSVLGSLHDIIRALDSRV